MKLKAPILAILTVLISAEIIGYILPDIEWLDVPFHIAGGIAWAMMAAWMIRRTRMERIIPEWFKFAFVVGLVMFIGSGWETLEFLLVRAEIFSDIHFTLRDTIGDLFNDGIGSLIGWFLFVRNLK